MRKFFCFCISAVLLAGTFCGCTSKNQGGNDNGQPTTAEVTTEQVTATEAETGPVDNSASPFLGKWETYKVSVNGEVYESVYAGYPLSSIAKLVIKEDNTAEYIDNLNPHGKERVLEYKWSITSDKNGSDVLHLLSPDERLDCVVNQGEMTMTNPDMSDETDIYYLLSVSEFTEVEKNTEAGLDKVDFSRFMGKWEASHVTMGEEEYDEKLGEYPVYAAFRLELKKDHTAEMTIIGDIQEYEWEPETKDQLYMWSDYEGFVIKIESGSLVIDDEMGLVIKLKKVNEFTEYDFEAVGDSIPDENILLEPEEEATT